MKEQKSIRAQEHKSVSNFVASSLIACALMICALILAGCAEQQKYEPVEQIYVPGVNKVEAMQIAEDVLVNMHFTVEKADTESGIITTKPLPGAQFFELWRSDNIDSFSAAEANLQSIRRTARLNIKPQDDKIYIDCFVHVQRLSLPESQELNLAPEQPTLTAGAEWIDLGKDTQLATEILKRIEKKYKPQP